MIYSVIFIIIAFLWPSFILGNHFNVTLVELPIGLEQKYSVNSTSEYIIEVSNFTSSIEKTPPRVNVTCLECNALNPVLVVVRQSKGVLSWELPVTIKSHNKEVDFHETSRTLCPYEIINTTTSSVFNLHKRFDPHYGNDEEPHSITISLSTSSIKTVDVFLNVTLVDDFIIGLNQTKTITITPSTPKFYFYEFSTDPSLTQVLLTIESESDTCLLVSIQNVSCPIFDLERSVQYEGIYETVTRQGGLTITRESYPNGFYVVFVTSSEEEGCTEFSETTVKKIDISLHETISFEYYIIALGVTLVTIVGFYVLMLVATLFLFRTNNIVPKLEDDLLNNSPSTSNPGQRSGSVGNSAVQSPLSPVPEDTLDTLSIKTDSSLDETDLDVLTDAELDKNVFRLKAFLYVSDLARKNPTVLKKKSQLFFWNLLTVATFYFLPVLQVVITYQEQLSKSGKVDICYYNFLCSNPWWVFADFNHVFSNVGYVFLGLLFMFLTYKKESSHRKLIASHKKLDRFYGIPQHFGLFYAMGAALFIEGVMSACYHVCPNKINFQFDTSFMYVISTLCMLKIYQTRHPDINASAYFTFFVLAVVIFLGMLGIVSGTQAFWTIFTILHLFTCLYLSLQIYYMGRWSLDFCSFRRTWVELKSSCRVCNWRFFVPMYPARFTFIVFANLCNWGLSIGKIWYNFNDFASYLLHVFLVNLLLYTMFYITMKFIYKEKILLQSWVYIILACVCWMPSLYFFISKSISWKLTPAASRTFNRPCFKGLNFYDNHDVWHFGSAAAMFFSFMVLLTLDDDLVFVHRSRIPVF